MKNVLILFIALLSINPAIAKEKIEIKALKAVELEYPEFAEFDVKISNSSGKQLDVAVIDPSTKKQVSGFGLGPFGKATLSVKPGNILRIKNNSASDITVSLDFVERQPEPESYVNARRINFTLRNNTMKSIPLIIPEVMNPNLSPMSSSGVSLRIGQEIFYKKGMKKVLILTVDESIEEGDKIDVAKLIKETE